MTNARTRLLLAALTATLPAAAADSNRSDVVIYLVEKTSLAQPSVLQDATAITTRIFDAIGVRVAWKFRKPSLAESARSGPEQIVMLLEEGRRDQAHSAEAFAYAQPYAHDGVRVAVYYDKVLDAAQYKPRAASSNLAHVLAHEIGHILEAGAWHSDSGIMRAHWTQRDLEQAQRKPMDFAAIDAELIHVGMSSRASASSRAMVAAMRAGFSKP